MGLWKGLDDIIQRAEALSDKERLLLISVYLQGASVALLECAKRARTGALTTEFFDSFVDEMDLVKNQVVNPRDLTSFARVVENLKF